MRILSTGIIILMLIFIAGCKNETNKNKGDHNTSENSQQLIEQGKEIASETFLALSGELQNAMKSGGINHALSYCNLNAISITDSIAQANKVKIKRTSLKFRNAANKPSLKEEEILKDFESKKEVEGGLAPLLVSENNDNIFYAPIIMQDMCLKCHGSKQEIIDYDRISSLYPNDLAYGYKQGDVRGMWSIKFSNK